MNTEIATQERPIIFSGPMVLELLAGRKTQTRRVVKEAHKSGTASAVCRAALSGWIAWYNPGTTPGALDAFTEEHYKHGFESPHGSVGDRLWVREAWRPRYWDEDSRLSIEYRADGSVRTLIGDYGTTANEWLDNTIERASAECERKRVPVGENDSYTWKPGSSPLAWRSPLFLPRFASRITLEVTGVRVERLKDLTEADAIAEGITTPIPHKNYPFLMAGGYQRAYAALWDSLHRKEHTWADNPWVFVTTFRAADSSRPSVTVSAIKGNYIHGYSQPFFSARCRLRLARFFVAFAFWGGRYARTTSVIVSNSRGTFGFMVFHPVDKSMFRDSGDARDRRTFWDVPAAAIHFVAHGIIESGRLSFLVGVSVRNPIAGPVDSPSVPRRWISVGNQQLNLWSGALHICDCTRHEPRLSVLGRAVFNEKTGQFPRDVDTVTLRRFARRQCEDNHTNVGRLIFFQQPKDTDGHSRPAVKIMLFNQTVNVVAQCRFNGIGVHAPTFPMSRSYVRRLPTVASTNAASRFNVWWITLPSFSLQVNSSTYRKRCFAEA